MPRFVWEPAVSLAKTKCEKEMAFRIQLVSLPALAPRDLGTSTFSLEVASKAREGQGNLNASEDCNSHRR